MELSEQGETVRLTIRMFGQLALFREGRPLALPPSRKVRALLAYLALAPHPVGRSRLCELLGDVPNDPRGELRWCLSKLRTILDEPERRRVLTIGEMISLDLSDCDVDALQIDAASQSDIATLHEDHLRALCERFVGDFLEGLELNRSPQLEHWLTIQRRRFKALQISLVEALAGRLPRDSAELRRHMETWVALAPLDAGAHAALLSALLASGQRGEAERQFSAALRLFEVEGVESDALRRAWRELRASGAAMAAEASRDRIQIGTAEPRRQADATPGPHRSSLAVMPFCEPDASGGQARLGAGLTHDIITRLARLRSLFVIARGSVYALAEQGIDPEEAARRLNVDYFVTGILRRRNDRGFVMVELVEMKTARIVWSEAFDLKPDDTFLVMDQIGDRIVASIASEIETAEKNRALLKPPSSLNAWESYHRGLWHMYRFTKEDNDLAQQFFLRSSSEDPTFARAFAGLSFTHWQNAFQNWADRERETHLAFETAGRSLIVDDRDPAAHWAMGRALWLRSRVDLAVAELEQAVDLSPNFALGHYALSFVQSQSGDPAAAIASADHSRNLSPFDPLLFGMFGARAMAHVRLGQYEEAADWAIRAATRPNAHKNILAIAAYCLALAGRKEEGRTFAALIRQESPGYGVQDFLAAFSFPPETAALFRTAARDVALD